MATLADTDTRRWWYRWPVPLLVVLVVLSACEQTRAGTCPTVCTCKWKGGKQTVECTDRALITIPEGVDAETQVLDLSGNNLQILPRETFERAGLLNLQRVFLKSCRIGQIDDLAFRGLTNLIELDLSSNLLTAIPSGTFQDVPFLRDLVLANNPIQKIESHAFQTVPGLVKLDLSNCVLQMVAPKAFEGIELLESLKINGNQLTELRPRTVETLSHLHGVELHDNPWHCDCRLRPVKEWLMHNNIPYPVAPICSGGPERVIHKTFGELHVDDFACKPTVLPVSRYIEATAGDNATIVCRASAVPAANINWYWNGRLLVNNSAFSSHQRIVIMEDGRFEKRSSLVLTNAQETDSSEFYCVAENRAGNAEANFTLRVSMRAAGMVSLGSGQIAGLSAALVILILFILLVILVLLVRLKRMPFSESKTPGQIEVVTVVNGATIPNGKVAISPTNPHMDHPSSQTAATAAAAAAAAAAVAAERKLPTDLNFCNPVQKPPRVSDISYSTSHYNGGGSIMNAGSCFVSPSSGSGNNPDLINDTKMPGDEKGSEASTVLAGGASDLGGYSVESLIDRPGSGEYSRNNVDSLYPSGLWDHGSSAGDTNGDHSIYSRHLSATNPGFHYDDKTPIMGDALLGAGGSDEELSYHRALATAQAVTGTLTYPADYGLPMVQDGKSSTGSDSLLLSTASSMAGGLGAGGVASPPVNAKTLRVWQKGAVPVLPPVTALKRALTHSRNSPDEGYQEGCGTDV